MADKRFNLTFDVNANIEPIRKSVNELYNSFKALQNAPDGLKKGIENTFSKLSEEIENFEAIASKGFTNMSDVSKAEKSFNKINDLIAKLSNQMGQVKGLDPKKFLPQDNIKKAQELQRSWKKLQDTVNKGLGNSAEITKQNQQLEKQNKELEKIQSKRDALSKANVTYGQEKGVLSKSLTADKKAAEDLVKKMSELEKVKGAKNTGEYKSLANDLNIVNSRIKENNKRYLELTNEINDNRAAISGYDSQIKDFEKNIDDINQKLQELKNTANQTPEGLTELRNQLADFKGVDLSDIPTDLNKIEEEINSLNSDEIAEVVRQQKALDVATEQAGDAAETASGEFQDLKASASGFNEKAKEMEQLGNQVKAFFSIGNTVQLFKRAINSAFETIKDLDAVMTQTAVVTDFTVSDMWAQLPEYTKRANELGVSVKGAYEAATLYYQQGLSTNEVIGVSNETLKMARIAAIDYATATDYMTSALRGFNMEVNEGSARRINDIYSQLAAKTAADTEEISIAMSKTAPLAHNAGMEIETTAALLSQMIETTREAPETLGTAMKTVIARFQELKKDPALIEPVEGEIIDANKIEAALRTIDVSLRDTSGQFRELDDVFLEISRKWDSLDTNTQRYIATIAAGSRQQSRFIAMMANYDRTMQLVSLANNSAGASQQQFEKTLDSMASKLDRLRNAWNEFTMSLANNTVIKGVISLLTQFLNAINKLSTAASGKNSFIKSLIDIGLLMGGLKLAKAAFNGFFSWLIKDSAVAGKAGGFALGKGFSEGFTKAINGFKKVFSKTTWINEENIVSKKAVLSAKRSLDAITKQFKDTASDIDSHPLVTFGELNYANREYQKTLEAFGKSLKLTNAEQEVSNFLQAQGVKESAANLAAVSGLTKQELNEYITKMALNGATKEEIRERLKNAAVIRAELGVEMASQQVQQMGILTKTKNIALMLFADKAARKEAAGKLGLAAADTAAAGAQSLLNKAILGFPLGWILAGIGAIIALTVVLVKHIKSLSLESRMKAAAEETKRAKEAADAARESYDNLLSDKSGYDDLQQSLKDLTYGTLEWKQALIDANQQVLNLLRSYPQLAQYLEKGDYGQLTIMKDGWDAVIKAQEQAVNNTTTAYAMSQSREQGLSSQKARQDLSNSLMNTLSGPNGLVDNTLVNKLTNIDASEFFRIGENGEYSKELTDLAKQYGISADQLYKAKEAIEEYNNAIEENKIEALSATRATLTTALSSETINNLEGAADYIVNGFSNKLVESAQNNSEKYKAEDLYTAGDSEWLYNTTFQALAKQYGVAGKMVGKDMEDLLTLYSEMSNVSIEDAKTSFGKDKKAIAKAIADLANANDVNTSMQQFADHFVTLGKDSRDIISLALSDGVTYIEGIEAQSKDDLEKIYTANEDYLKTLYGTSDDFVAAYETAIENGQKDIEEAKENLRKLELSTGGFGEGLDAGAIKGLSKHISEVFRVSGKDAAQSLMDSIQGTIDTISAKAPDKLKDFTSTINSIDWKNLDEVNGLSDSLRELTENGTITEEEFNELEQQIIELAKASKQVELDKLIEQVQQLSKLSYQIKQGTQGRDFSEDAKKSLIESGAATADDFYYNVITDSWTYLGGSLDELREAINKNTNALLDESGIQSQINSSRAAQSVIDSLNDGINTQNRGELSSAIRQYLYAAGEDAAFSFDEYSKALREKGLQGLQELWNTIVQEGGSLEVRQQQSVKIQKDAVIADNVINNSAYDNAAISTESSLAALQQQAVNAGVAEQYLNNYTEALKSNDEVTQHLAASTLAMVTASYQLMDVFGLDKTEVEAFANQLETLYSNTLTAEQALQIATRNTLLNTGLNEIISSYEDWTSLIDESSGKIVANTSDEAKTFNQLKQSIQKMLGVSEDLSESFWDNTKNIDAMKRAAEGDTEAIEDLQKAASKDYLLNLDFESITETAQSAVEEFYNYLEGIDLPQLEAGIQWDDTGSQEFIEAFNRMAQQANLSAGQIQEAAQRMGFNAEVTYVRQTRQIPRTVTEETVVPTGIFTKKITTTSYVDGYDDVTALFPVVKTLTSSGSGGGGISTKTIDAGKGNKGKSGSSSGGGSSAKEEEPWENPYDWLYNLTKKINANLRERNKLEREYTRGLERNLKNGKQLYETSQKQIRNLKEQNSLLGKESAGRTTELQRLFAQNPQYTEYVRFDAQLGELQIDWNKIEQITDKTFGEGLEKLISKAEEVVDRIHEIDETIEDNNNDIYEITQRGIEAYRNLEDRVLDAIIARQQEFIDNQKNTYDAINNANTSLTDSISKNISKLREDRQREETEAQIAEKQRRLAYLRQDTTGANALEIQKLQKELAKEEQDFTDNLIDQSISQLKEQNDAAAQQRDREIELMQSQLDWAIKNGQFINEATRIVQEGLGENGTMNQSSALYRLLSTYESLTSMTNASRRNWMNELSQTIAEAFIGNKNMSGTIASQIATSTTPYNITSAKGIQIAQSLGIGQSVTVSDGSTWYKNTDGSITVSHNGKIYEGFVGGASGTTATTSANANTSSYSGSTSTVRTSTNNSDSSSAAQLATSSTEYKITSDAGKTAAEYLVPGGQFIASDGSTWTKQSDGSILVEKNGKTYQGKVYATGGLADYTGPAWVDGTRTNPELVLNAKDTQNFIQLKDILSNIQTGKDLNKLTGDMYFDIDVNVDQISDDYDVNQVVNAVKQEIYNEATYRNVNAISYLK